ncbi:hypothetical protein SUGI_1025800 [Cryptomeria japonica]|nr:hypothetical protein SUGI_1025800 [Cryptomeria japonica]
MEASQILRKTLALEEYVPVSSPELQENSEKTTKVDIPSSSSSLVLTESGLNDEDKGLDNPEANKNTHTPPWAGKCFRTEECGDW